MVNRYENPAEAQFLNTYVPIPFEQLFQLGQQAKSDVDRATQQLTGTINTWSKFQSPSAVDTEAYYNETINKIAPVINELSSNLDLLKSAEGRAKLYSTLNNLDYAKISQLQQSAIGLTERMKANQELMKAGRYNPEWHGIEFDKYDTTNSGIFNDVAPLAYKNIQEIADPYVSGIKDSFLRSAGGYDYTGVTADTIRNLIGQNRTAILASPESQQHVNVLMRNGLTREQAENAFIQEASAASVQKYARENRSENRFALENMKLENAKRIAEIRSGDSDSSKTSNNPAFLTDQLAYVGTQTISNNVSNYANIFQTANQVMQNPNDADFDKKFVDALKTDANTLYETVTGVKYNGTRDTPVAIAGTRAVLDAFKSSIPGEAADILLSSQSTDVIKTSRGEEKFSPTSKGMMLPELFAASHLLGDARTDANKDFRKFAKALEDGKYNSIGMISSGEQFVFNDENGEIKQALRVSISIPVKELEDKSIRTSKFLEKLDGYGVIYDDDGKKSHVVFDVIKPIPNDGATKSWINQEFLNSQTRKQFSDAQYVKNQSDSFQLDN